MRKYFIEQLLEPKNIPYHILENLIKNNIQLPMFRTSEKIILNKSTGEEEKQIGLFCSNCNNHFYLNRLVFNITCPNCGSDTKTGFPLVLKNYSEGFEFSNEPTYTFCNIKDFDEIRYQPLNFHYDSLNNEKKFIDCFFILNKNIIDGETFYSLYKIQLYFNMDIENNEREIMFCYFNDIIIFSKDEIVNIKNGKKSVSTFFNTYSKYYYNEKRNIIADDKDIKDFKKHIENYNFNSTLNIISNTKTDNVFVISVSLIDKLYNHIKSKKPVSKTYTNRQFLVDSITNAIIPSAFSIKENAIYYDVIETDRISHKNKFEYICPNCKSKNVDIMISYPNLNEDTSFICNHCASSHMLSSFKQVSYHKNSNHVVNVVQDIENGVIVYDYLYECIAVDNKLQFTPTKDYKPNNIIFIKETFDPDGIASNTVILRKNNDNNTYSISKKLNVYDCNRQLYILNNANNFNMKWSAIEKLNGDSHKNSVSVDCVAAYILIYRKYPVMEKLLKENLCSIVDSIIHTFKWQFSLPDAKYKLSHNDVASALQISKKCLKILKQYPTDNHSIVLYNLQLLYNADNNVSEEDYNYFMEHQVSCYVIANINRKFGFTTHQIYKYLERVRISQCLNPNIAINEWADYLDASKLIGCDLSDKRVKYPAALRTEHDKAMYKKSIIENKDYENNFKKVTDEYGKKYSYQNKDYIITYPKSLNDLFEEGRILNHCVGTYGDSIKNGNSIILFVRKTEEPNTPYFTLEVNPFFNAVTQLYGHSDTPPNSIKNKSLIEFVRKWALKHDISY